MTKPTGPLDEPTLELPVVRTGRFRMPWWPAGLAAVAAAAVLGLLIVRSGDTGPAPPRVVLPSGPIWQVGPPPVAASGRPPGVARAAETIAITGGSAAITLRTADLGGARYRIVPAGTPVSERAGVLQIAPGAGPVEVTLAVSTDWRLSVAGADRSSVDSSRARLTAVDLSGGTAITLTLPHPDGTLTVHTTGGVDHLGLRTASRVPVRVRVGSGAGRVTLDGATHDGVTAGALFTPAGWDGAADRVDVDATAGLAALTVATY